MLNNIKNLKNDKGFTIVELLIVIVVIAILAAITIVAYNGIQTRAKTSSGQAAAASISKKMEALNAVKGSYYSSSLGLTGALINTYANAAPIAGEAVVDTPSSVIAATSASSGATLTSTTASNGTVVAVWGCALGAEIYYFDYNPSVNAPVLVTAGAGC